MGVEENDHHHTNGNGRLLIDENGIANKKKKSKFRECVEITNLL